MKQLVLGLLVMAGFSNVTFADEGMNPMDRDFRRGVRCVARDNWGETYEGYDRDYSDARREAMRNCWESRRHRWGDHDRDRDHERDHRRRNCYIVRCSRGR